MAKPPSRQDGRTGWARLVPAPAPQCDGHGQSRGEHSAVLRVQRDRRDSAPLALPLSLATDAGPRPLERGSPLAQPVEGAGLRARRKGGSTRLPPPPAAAAGTRRPPACEPRRVHGSRRLWLRAAGRGAGTTCHWSWSVVEAVRQAGRRPPNPCHFGAKIRGHHLNLRRGNAASLSIPGGLSADALLGGCALSGDGRGPGTTRLARAAATRVRSAVPSPGRPFRERHTTLSVAVLARAVPFLCSPCRPASAGPRCPCGAQALGDRARGLRRTRRGSQRAPEKAVFVQRVNVKLKKRFLFD